MTDEAFVNWTGKKSDLKKLDLAWVAVEHVNDGSEFTRTRANFGKHRIPSRLLL